MDQEIVTVLNGIRSNGYKVSVDTITNLGLLVERAIGNRYHDTMYRDLGMPPSWLDLRLNAKEIEEILRVLAEVLDRNAKLAPTAAWALGKSYRDSTVTSLVSALNKYWQLDDETTYQLLVALDNHGKEKAAELIDRIANEGIGRSREFAIDLKSRM